MVGAEEAGLAAAGVVSWSSSSLSEAAEAEAALLLSAAAGADCATMMTVEAAAGEPGRAATGDGGRCC